MSDVREMTCQIPAMVGQPVPGPDVPLAQAYRVRIEQAVAGHGQTLAGEPVLLGRLFGPGGVPCWTWRCPTTSSS